MNRRWFLLFPVGAWASPGLTTQMWNDIGNVYRATLDHPFLRGLTSGTLPRAKFQFYLIQDSLYLGAYSRALAVLASKAPRQEWAVALNRDAIETLEVEKSMHGEVLASYGIDSKRSAAAEMAPVNYAYTNHLLLTVERGSFAEGLAAMLPCYWIYWEVGKELIKRGSSNKDYQRWIKQYSGEEYGKTVRRVLAMMDDAATGADPRRLRQLFLLSARYEYLFWDMAWREEAWRP